MFLPQSEWIHDENVESRVIGHICAKWVMNDPATDWTSAATLPGVDVAHARRGIWQGHEAVVVALVWRNQDDGIRPVVGKRVVQVGVHCAAEPDDVRTGICAIDDAMYESRRSRVHP